MDTLSDTAKLILAVFSEHGISERYSLSIFDVLFKKSQWDGHHLLYGSSSKLTGRVMRAHKTVFAATAVASGIYFKEKDGMGVQLIERDLNYLHKNTEGGE